MKHSTRAYTDLEIAEYVLGLAAPGDTAGIQAWLAQDNAAAACALKWEAYLLDIADDLPGEPPAPGLYTRIQNSLGFAALADDAAIVFEGRAIRANHPRRGRRSPLRRLRRGRIVAVAAILAALVLLIIFSMAVLRPAEQRTTEHTVQLTPLNPALPPPAGQDPDRGQ
uniref:hypothetical protein n=1 Tax=Castellaniella defragrans TaxID=75697 RepID=UPI00333F52D5